VRSVRRHRTVNRTDAGLDKNSTTSDCPTETGGLSAGHTPGKCDSEDLLKIPVRNYRRTIRCRVRTVRRQFSAKTESRPCWNSEPGGADSPRRLGRTVRVLESSRPEAGGARPLQSDCPGFSTGLSAPVWTVAKIPRTQNHLSQYRSKTWSKLNLRSQNSSQVN